MLSWLAEELMKGSTLTVLGGLLTIAGAAVTLRGGYLSGQQRAKTDQTLIEGNTEVQQKLENAKDALIAKNDELAGVQRELAATQAALVNKTDQYAALNKKFADYAMGAGSFFYLHLRKLGTDSVEARIIHVGDNPVRDTEVISYDVTNQWPNMVSGAITKFDLKGTVRRRTFLTSSYQGPPSKLVDTLFETSPARDSYFYFVYFAGANGTYRQLLQLLKVGDEWRQAYKIERVLGGDKREAIGEHFDRGFPTERVGAFRPSDEYPELVDPEATR